MPGNVIIAIIAPVQPEDFFDLVWQGVWEATFDLAPFGVQVQNLTTEHRDVARQREILHSLLGADLAAIGILPAHASALNELINQHELRGTPVITFQGDAPESRRSAFVGPNAERSGALAGEALAKFMGGRGRVLSFCGDQGEFQLAGRYAGLQAELARSEGRIQEAVCQVRLDENASAQLKVVLEAADGIYVGNEDLVRVAAALEESRIRVPCVGFSNTQAARRLLQHGIVSAVIDESRYHQGYFVVQKAYEATLKGDRTRALENVHMPSAVAFSANAAEQQESMNDAFEMLVRQRTEVLFSYKARLEEANAELLNLSVTDPLTGLLNRRQFEKSLEQEAARSFRYGPMSLLMVDLDLFKVVNDTYGHQAGDEVLKAVAKGLTSCCRSTDVCARLGGDEFAMILPHADGPAAAGVRDRVRQRVSETRVPVGQESLGVSLSIGIGTMPGDAEDVAGLMAAADADMYRMKQASRQAHGSNLMPR